MYLPDEIAFSESKYSEEDVVSWNSPCKRLRKKDS